MIPLFWNYRHPAILLVQPIPVMQVITIDDPVIEVEVLTEVI